MYLLRQYIPFLASIVAYMLIGYFVPRLEFELLMLLVIVVFANYYLIIKKFEAHFLYWFSIVFRLLFIFSTPALSDDYFRFIWDGRLLNLGENPFLNLPSFYYNSQLFSKELNSEIFNGLNSPNYFTVYPPVCQMIYFSATLFSKSILSSVVIMRLFIIFADLGVIYFGKKLLSHFRLEEKRMYWYALNPLIIIELTGNLHFEGIMLFFLLGAVYFLIQNKMVLGGVFYAFSINTKLIPLMFLPFFISILGIRKSLYLFAYIGAFTILLFAPYISKELITNFYSSIDLYFQKFEFNASLYYLFRWIGFQIYGYNIIQTLGKIFPILIFVSILALAFLRKDKQWNMIFENILFAFSIYLAFASIVHPWYISTLVLISIFTKYNYALLWSGLAFLSYWAYAHNLQENMWFIGLEYGVVFACVLWEITTKKIDKYGKVS